MMAEGTFTGEMPSFDLRACSEAKKRPFSSDGSEFLFVTCCNVFFFVCVSRVSLNLKVILLKILIRLFHDKSKIFLILCLCNPKIFKGIHAYV